MRAVDHLNNAEQKFQGALSGMYAGSALCFAQHFSLCRWAVPRNGLLSLQQVADLQP